MKGLKEGENEHLDYILGEILRLLKFESEGLEIGKTLYGKIVNRGLLHNLKVCDAYKCESLEDYKRLERDIRDLEDFPDLEQRNLILEARKHVPNFWDLVKILNEKVHSTVLEILDWRKCGLL